MKKTSNPFFDDIQRNGITLVLPLAPRQRGKRHQPERPRRGEAPRPSRAKSVRLPDRAWEALYERARRDRTTVNAQIRQAVDAWQKQT